MGSESNTPTLTPPRFQKAGDNTSFTYVDAVPGTMLPGVWNKFEIVTSARPAANLLLPRGGIAATHG